MFAYYHSSPLTILVHFIHKEAITTTYQLKGKLTFRSSYLGIHTKQENENILAGYENYMHG